MARLRTFIAVDLPKPIRENLSTLQANLAECDASREVKWVDAKNLHVTLLFLGEVSDREVANVCNVVAEATSKHRSFSINVEAVGAFPNLRRPHVIWAGIQNGAENLVAIHADLERPFAELGYRREERRFTPHITLGRVKAMKTASPLVDALTKYACWRGGATVVREIHVMSSELTPRGPAYTILSRCPLG